MLNTTANSQKSTANDRDKKKWVMCPVCHEANSPDNMFCRHCHGNRITKLDNQPLRSLVEIEQSKNEWLSRRRARKTLWRTSVAVVSLLAVIALTVGVLFYFTDLIGAPRPGMSSDSATGEWSMFGYDLARTSGTGSSAALPTGALKWVFTTGRGIYASAVVVDGVVYVGSTDNNFYAIEAQTGDELWRFTAGSWFESSAAVAGGTVYVGSNDSRLYALDAVTGEKRWEYTAKYGVRSSPALAEGRIYFSSGDYTVHALDAQTGRMLWTFEAEGAVSASPVVANGIVYVGDQSNYLYALDAVTGRRRLRFKSYGGTASSAAVSGTTVYFANKNGILFAVDGTARNWPNEHNMRFLLYRIYVQSLSIVPPMWLLPPNQSGFLWAANLGGRIYSSPAVLNDRLFIGAGDRLVAVDMESYRIDWALTTGNTVSSSPAVIDGVVFAGSRDGNLYAVEAGTGEEVWRFVTGAAITSSPAVADGVVYIGSHDGNLYAIE